MKLNTFLSIAQSGRLRALRALSVVAPELYRAAFLVAAARAGLLVRLAAGSLSLAEIRAVLGIDAGQDAGLESWLAVGESVGEVRQEDGRWRLAGALARALALPNNDDLLAMLEEVVDLHHRLMLLTPDRLRDGRPFALSEQDGLVIARSSRVVEPLIHEAIDDVVPTTGRLRLLEIGCGSGVYIHHYLSRNPDLEAVGLELQPQVADVARANLHHWGHGARVTVESCDVRTFQATGTFDLITLHNNIYYFPVADRVALLVRLRSLLSPGGRLLLTTSCAGGSPAVAVLSLWGAVTEGCGPLPLPSDMIQQFRDAGFHDVKAKNLASPLDQFYAFVAN